MKRYPTEIQWNIRKDDGSETSITLAWAKAEKRSDLLVAKEKSRMRTATLLPGSALIFNGPRREINSRYVCFHRENPPVRRYLLQNSFSMLEKI